MAKKRMEIELKAGLFVGIGVFLMMLAIIVLGSAQSLFQRQSHFVTHMATAEGLIPGAKVMMSGIHVGTIDSLIFDGERREVAIKFSVDQKSTQWVRKDSSVEVETQGVLGDKFLSVNPGTESSPQLNSGDEVAVHQGRDLNQFLNKGDQLLVSLTSIATDLNKITKDFTVDNRSEVFFQGLAMTSKNMSEASAKLNRQLDEMPLKSAVKNLNAILEKINSGSGTLGALVNDSELYDSAKALVGGANRNRVVRNLVRQAVEKGEAGEASDAASAPKK
jgi:phospholipid/cholesterol/gamma-HCH transport system substrate-binding protein